MRKVPNWDDYFLSIAEVVKIRSKDPNTQVGAVIVAPNNRIVSTGYNGFRPHEEETKEKWAKGTKKQYVKHAEHNAIDFAEGEDLSNCTIYLGFWPCIDCSRRIIKAGISRIVCKTDYYYAEATEKLLKDFEIEISTKESL